MPTPLIDLATATTLLATHPRGADWTSETYSDDDRTRALHAATQVINSLDFLGQPTDPDQPNAWPRKTLYDPQRGPIPDDTTPEQVQLATAEIALETLTQGRKGTPDDEALVTQITIGEATQRKRAQIADDMPRAARRLLRPFLRTPSAYNARLHP